MFEAGGDQMSDIQIRIVRVKQRFGKMRYKNIGSYGGILDTRIKCCTGTCAWGCTVVQVECVNHIHVFSEVSPKICEVLNGVNLSMVIKITGRTIREEMTDGKTFDLVKWITSRRLQWLGHIWRMGTDRKTKQTVFEMFRVTRPGDRRHTN